MRERLRSESVRSGVNNKLSSLASKNNKRQFGTFSDAGASEPKGWLHQTEAAELSFFPPFAHSVNAHRVSTPHLALSSLALCSRVPTLLSLSLSLSSRAPIQAAATAAGYRIERSIGSSVTAGPDGPFYLSICLCLSQFGAPYSYWQEQVCCGSWSPGCALVAALKFTGCI